MKKGFKTVVALCAMLISGQVLADWQLDNSQSRLHFISIKNTHISEIHRFDQLSGSLSDSGALKVNISLASVNTGISIRDIRIKEKMFNLAEFANAEISAQLNGKLLEKGTEAITTVPFTLTLNGKHKELEVEVVVQKTADTLTASSVKPIVINAEDFGLKGGIDILRALAALNNISYAVPVSFHLSFVKG